MFDFAASAGVSTLLMTVLAIGSFIFAAIIVGALFWFVGLFFWWDPGSQEAFAQSVFFGFPFSVLGVTVGVVTSLSREPAAAAVLPAILSLVGGVCVFLVSKGGRSAVISAVSIVMLCVSFSAGIGYGSRARVENEQIVLSLTTQMALSNRELNIKRYRKSIGLDDVPPAPVPLPPAIPAKP